MVKSNLFTIEMHENGQSEHNYAMDVSNFYHIKKSQAKRINLGLQQVLTQRLQKSTYNCYEKDSQISFSNCLNNHYVKKLGCKLPWFINDSSSISKNATICNGKSKFEEFKNLSLSIIQPDINGEIKATECFVPNCSKRKWTINSVDVDYDLHSNSRVPNGTQMKLTYTL